MDNHPHTETDKDAENGYTSNDHQSLHVVITHLQTRVAELESHLDTLQHQQQRPSLMARGQALAAKLTPARLASQVQQRIPQRLRLRKRPKATVQKKEDTRPTERSITDTIEKEKRILAETPLMVRMTIITLVSLLLGWASEVLLGWASEVWLPVTFVPWVFYAIAYINGSFYFILLQSKGQRRTVQKKEDTRPTERSITDTIEKEERILAETPVMERTVQKKEDTRPTERSITDTIEEEERILAETPVMVRMTIITLVSLLLGWASEVWLPVAFVPWVFYAIAYINGSFYSIQEAWGTLKQRQFDVNLLMIAAALGAAVINQPLEGATLMFLFSLSQTLETYAMGRTHASIRALIDMTPKTARVIQVDNTYQRGDSHSVTEREIPVDDVAVGDIVRVRPGEQIPTDGVVVRGASAVNEASITGESMPIEKQIDGQVFAGTINGQGSLDIRVTTASDDSTLAHIVKIVSEARQQKARSQHFTDKVIGQYYAYTVAAITLLAVIIPLLFLGWDTRTTVYRAITLMVGASPCALVISIPAAILSALASASWNGVLFKGGKHLESASRVKVVAFDKTGTLTNGQLGVAAIIPLPIDGQETWDTMPAPGEQLTQAQARVLALAAAVEQFSEHPLAQAIVTQAQQQQVTLASAESFESLTGFGVSAMIDDQRVQVGRPSLFTPVQDQTLAPAAMEAITAQEQKGHTVILVGTKDEVWGMLSLSDTIRPESADIVAGLKQAGVCCVMLLTGDNRYAAEHLAGQVGIDEVYAELTPQQKVETIRQIQADKGLVAMIGDGINDAPALATATLGVAMGAAGTDVAMESADVVLMSDDLSRLPGTLRLARHTRQIVRQNLVVSFSIMLVLVVLALGGFLPLTIATIAHEGSTLLVVANGLRLLASWR